MNGENKLNIVNFPEKVSKELQNLSDDVLQHLSFSMPWQYSSSEEATTDEDGFGSSGSSSEADNWTRERVQEECWIKFNKNPQFNTSVRRVAGRITGWGFETTSIHHDIQKAIEEIELDPRNRLYNFLPKYVARAEIEGELFLVLTVHPNGFIEVDFLDPDSVSGGGTDGSGILFHPKKTVMPLFYIVQQNSSTLDKGEAVPSIFIARYPELIEVARSMSDFDLKLANPSKSRKHVFRQFKGYYRFVVSWDKGFVTRRNVSHLRTVLEWLNHYENLKKYEIDHKKSSGAYLWVFKITDPRAFRLWLGMSDTDKRKTGIMAKKTPGSSLVLPPGMEVDVVNPNLSPIREQDTDIMEMVTSGMNEANDVTTGTSKGTFASIKASRGPMSDNISDEIAYFDRFWRNDFWGSVFFLKSAVSDFPTTFKVPEVVGFKPLKSLDTEKDPEPIIKNVKYRPEQLIEVAYPVSEMLDMESRTKALLGVKHGPIAETVGVPNSDVAKRIGIGGYGRSRIRKATEDLTFPKLVYNIDAESLQEKVEAEPPKKKADAKPKPKKEK